MVAWLNEIIYLIGEGVFLPASIEIRRLTDSLLEAEMAGESLDPERHHFLREVKAATYHGLDVTETERGWRTRVLFDV